MYEYDNTINDFYFDQYGILCINRWTDGQTHGWTGTKPKSPI